MWVASLDVVQLVILHSPLFLLVVLFFGGLTGEQCLPCMPCFVLFRSVSLCALSPMDTKAVAVAEENGRIGLWDTELSMHRSFITGAFRRKGDGCMQLFVVWCVCVHVCVHA